MKKQVVSSAGHNIVKGFENYSQMIDILRPISFEVFVGITQVLDYFMYCLLFIFCNEKARKNLVSEISLAQLKTNLKEEETNIPLLEVQHDIFIFQNNYLHLKAFFIKTNDSVENLTSKMKKGDLNLSFNCMSNQIYNEFTERIIAVESLQFILDYFNLMKTMILKLNPDPKHASYILDAYNNYQNIYPQLKYFIYNGFIPSLFKNDNIFSNIPNLKWDTKDPNPELANIYIGKLQ